MPPSPNVSSFKPSSTANLAYSLYLHPTDPLLDRAHRHYLSQKYPRILDEPADEERLCVVSTGRNLGYQNRYMGYLDSIVRQDYANYHLVYIDDASIDGTLSLMQDYISANVRLDYQGRFILLSTMDITDL